MKIKGGFTLLEVLLALLILVSAISIFSSLQLRSIDRVWKGREEIQRIFLIKKYLYDLYFNPPKREKPVVVSVEDPLVKITSEFTDIDKRSTLKNFVDDQRFISSVGEWKSGTDDMSLKIFSLVKKPEEKEKNK